MKKSKPKNHRFFLFFPTNSSLLWRLLFTSLLPAERHLRLPLRVRQLRLLQPQWRTRLGQGGNVGKAKRLKLKQTKAQKQSQEETHQRKHCCHPQESLPHSIILSNVRPLLWRGFFGKPSGQRIFRSIIFLRMYIS